MKIHLSHWSLKNAIDVLDKLKRKRNKTECNGQIKEESRQTR